MLAMACVGVGEILGSAVFGRIQDKQTIKVVVLSNLVFLLIAFTIMLAFHSDSGFNFWLACLMTLSWGFQDAGNSCCIYCMLGFQFDSKSTPFSVFCLTQSLSLIVFSTLQGMIASHAHYHYYFATGAVVSLFAWVTFLSKFEFRQLTK